MLEVTYFVNFSWMSIDLLHFVQLIRQADSVQAGRLVMMMMKTMTGRRGNIGAGAVDDGTRRHQAANIVITSRQMTGQQLRRLLLGRRL